MRLRKPDYYERFRCIAGACSDSYCIGWEIDIDEKQKEVYRQLCDSSNVLGERMKSCVDWEEGHFILQGKEERCPFLNHEHLCDLILAWGEDALCDICREHPRFYDWFDDLTEAGLGLCCEAAGRLILEHEEPVRFVEEELCGDAAGNTGEADFSSLFAARETAIQILQNRTCSIWKRLDIYLGFIEMLQEAMDFGGLEEVEAKNSDFVFPELVPIGERSECFIRGSRIVPELYRRLLVLCRRLEAIDEAWEKTLDELETFLKEQPFTELEMAMLEENLEHAYEYEHLAVYFVYRYFMKCREDGDFYSRGCLTVFCLLLIRLLDVRTFAAKGAVTMEDRMQNAKCVSKEIEYSEENLERLADAFWEWDKEYFLENY